MWRPLTTSVCTWPRLTHVQRHTHTHKQTMWSCCSFFTSSLAGIITHGGHILPDSLLVPQQRRLWLLERLGAEASPPLWWLHQGLQGQRMQLVPLWDKRQRRTNHSPDLPVTPYHKCGIKRGDKRWKRREAGRRGLAVNRRVCVVSRPGAVRPGSAWFLWQLHWIVRLPLSTSAQFPVEMLTLCVCVRVCACTCGKVMQGRQHDGWHLGVIVIESVTPRTVRCQGDTHLHPFRRLSRGSIWHCADKERDWWLWRRRGTEEAERSSVWVCLGAIGYLYVTMFQPKSVHVCMTDRNIRKQFTPTYINIYIYLCTSVGK